MNKQKIQQLKSIQKQAGYLMLMVVVFLLVLVGGSAKYLMRETENIKTSGAIRDSTESLVMAESAMEIVRGQYIGRMDTVTESPNNVFDKIAASVIAPNKSSPDASPFPYMYYVTAGNGLDKTRPSILQLVANGEAVANTAATLSSRGIADSVSKIRINDMFATVGGNNIAPFMYVFDTNGILTTSTANNWAAETSDKKAVVWIELLQNPSDSTAVDLFVESVAQVGDAKSYVQRYVGTYNNVLGAVSVLAEASNINR